MQTTTYHNPATDLITPTKPLPVKLLVGLSLLVWAEGVVITRLWGHLLLVPTSPLSLDLCFLALAVVMPLTVIGIFRWQAIAPEQATQAVIWLVLPSMLLDVGVVEFFPQLFPNVPVSANGLFGAWLLWGYAISVLTGLMLSQPHKA